MSVDPKVLTRVVDPTGWSYLNAHAPVTGLSFEVTYPGGPTEALFTLQADPGAHFRGLTQGAACTQHRGGVVWSGKVSGIDRSNWQVTATGLAGQIAQEPVRITGTLDAIVDDAIANGLPVTRPASLSTTVWGQASGASGTTATDLSSVTLDEPLSDVLTAEGKFWRVTLDGRILAETAPTAPSLILAADTTPPLTLNTYATRITAVYGTFDSGGSTTTSTTVVNTVAEARFGRVPRTLDLSRFGGITATAAQLKAQAYLDRVSPRMVVSGDIPVAPGQLTTATGGPVDLALLRPGVVARVQLVTLQRDSLAVPTSSVDMLIGRVTYDADADTATISPVGSAPDPVSLMFGGRAKVLLPAA